MSLSATLQSGVSAVKAFTRALDVIGDNIANVNTTAFKRGRAEFGDSFYQLLQNPSGGVTATTTRPASQIGSGVQINQINTIFQQSEFEYTDNPTDLAISGGGFFQVVNPLDSSELFFTRSGNFRQDDQGYLVTPDGLRLQGNNGDLQIAPNEAQQISRYGDVMSNFSFEPETGLLEVHLQNGGRAVAGQIQLSNFNDPKGLTKKGSNLYAYHPAAGTRSDFFPGANASSSVHPLFLERSNVDLTDEFASMITTQRSFQAGARVITTADQVMQEAINLKR